MARIARVSLPPPHPPKRPSLIWFISSTGLIQRELDYFISLPEWYSGVHGVQGDVPTANVNKRSQGRESRGGFRRWSLGFDLSLLLALALTLRLTHCHPTPLLTCNV